MGKPVADKLAEEESLGKMLEWRARRWTYERIAGELGITKQAVHKRLKRALAQRAKANDAGLKELKAIELESLDYAARAIEERVGDGAPVFVQQWLNISDRRCKIQGLYAPERLEATFTPDPFAASAERKLAGALAALGPSDPTE